MNGRSGFQVMLRLIARVKPLTGLMILAVLMGVAGHLSATFITVFGGFAVLDLLNAGSPFSLKFVFIGVGLFALARGVLRYAEQVCNHYIAFKLLALIRDQVFTALRRLCPAKLEGRDKGNLIAVITSDIELLEVFYAHTISPVAIAFLFAGVLCVFIAHYHLLLGLIALTSYLVIGVIIPVMTNGRQTEISLNFRTKAGALSGFVLDNLRGLAETQQYGRGEQKLRELMLRSDELSLDEKKLKTNIGKNQAITNTTLWIFDLLMLLTASYLYQKGQIGFNGILVPTVALMSSFGPVLALAGLGGTLQNTLAAGNRVLDILDEEPVVQDIQGEEEIAFSGAAVKQVVFSYADETILDQVSVDVPEGQVIGIAGKSGSGKSTLLRLMMRFWRVDQGEIEISGKNIEQVNTDNLRKLQSFVTQETHLFRDSIRNNLLIAKPDATDEELIAACQKASLHDFITSLPHGYDTWVGELGDRLSGGERQRLGLARAFLRDAPLILLDEPTSNLDSLNEAVILKTLGEQRGDKTVILVSHRESTMRLADRVYCVENGRMS